eukprot:TRINITY_DN9827_c0_g1_i1.p1 TRINITY_DN9827_c0_g1~~TRINITY_DN9827_c0_g1_i1.p1  ORF type:complete len:231 (+),score=27.13 TRINITY_DN9827_c0_g1_i1:435-1127(+)
MLNTEEPPAFYTIKQVDAAMRFDHPNVLRMLGVFVYNGRCCIMADLLEGGSLQDKVSSWLSALPPASYEDFLPHAISLVKQALRGLAYIHARNTPHRYINLGSFLLTKDQQTVKITDFGLGEEFNVSITSATAPYYIPQEVRMAQASASIVEDWYKVDMWAFGVVAFIVCAGECPFSDPLQMDDTHYEVKYPKFFPATLKDLIKALLQRDPVKRIASGMAMLHPFMTAEM